MAERSTVPSDLDPETVLDAVADERRRRDARDAVALIRDVTGAEPRVWGGSILGFGRMSYATADGKVHEWFAVGLAARAQALTLYGLVYEESNRDLLDALGPVTTGKGCLYVRRLEKIDHEVLRRLVERAWRANHAEPEPELQTGPGDDATGS